MAPNTGDCMFEKPLKTFRIARLCKMDQTFGPHVRRISLSWIYFCGGTSKTEFAVTVWLIFQGYETAATI